MTLPYPLLLLLTLAVAALDWFAVSRARRRIEYVAKPAVMVLLFIWLYLATGLQGAMLYFGLGLLFSMLGDLFLLFNGQGWFLAGLGAFLLAQLCYVVGFNLTPPGTNLFSIITAILVAVLASRIYRRLAAGLVASGQARLRAPVLAYILVISLMLVSALLTLFRPGWLGLPSLMAAAGAALFFTSDTLLGWKLFIAPMKHSDLMIIISYHLGQLLLIAGVTLNYLYA